MVGRLGAATAAQKGIQPDELMQKSGMDLAVSVVQTQGNPWLINLDLNVRFLQSYERGSGIWSPAPHMGKTFNIPEFAKAYVYCFVLSGTHFLFSCSLCN